MNVDDTPNDPLADIDLLAGGEQSDVNEESEELDSDTETETADSPEGEHGGDTDESEEGSDDEEKGKDADKPKRPSGSERLKRRLAALTAENERLRGNAPAPVAGDDASIAAAVEAKIGKAPKQEDFPDYLDYEHARTAYEVDKRQATREVKKEIGQAQARQEEAFEDLVADHKDRLTELEKVIPGARKAIQSLDKNINPAVGVLILESEKSALLSLHLAKNPTKLDELNGMSERAAAKEIGRLEARLSLPKPKTKTSAPPPVVPPRGSAAVAKDPSKMSVSEYRAWRAKGGGK